MKILRIPTQVTKQFRLAFSRPELRIFPLKTENKLFLIICKIVFLTTRVI
jgi:hypothetical protein